jgi:hypothetical protein
MQIHTAFRYVNPGEFTFENLRYLLRCACDDYQYSEVENEIQKLNQKHNNMGFKLLFSKIYFSGTITAATSAEPSVYKFMTCLGNFYNVSIADYSSAIQAAEDWEEEYYRNIKNPQMIRNSIAAIKSTIAQNKAYKALVADFQSICNTHNSLGDQY